MCDSVVILFLQEEEKEKEDEYDKYHDQEHSRERERDRGRGRERGRDGDRYGHEDDEDSGKDGSYHKDREGDRINESSSRGRHRDRKDSDDEWPREDDRRETQLRSRDYDRGETSRVGRNSGVDRGSYREEKRYRDPGNDRVSRDGGAGQGYQESNVDQRELYYSTDRNYGADDRYHGDRSQRDDSLSPNRGGDCSGSSSYVVSTRQTVVEHIVFVIILSLVGSIEFY